MVCPYCSQKLTPTFVKTKAGQTGEVYECFSCGGHWFPRWLANDISEQAAQDLDAILAKLTVSPPEEPRCPVCQTRLSIIKHEESVPQSVTVWACPEGHGDFFPKNELIKFKSAQETKISYLKLWNIPIRSVFAVLLPVLAVFALLGGVPLVLRQLQTPQESRITAGATYSQPLINVIGASSAIIFFTSSSPVTSSLTLYQNGVFHSTHTIASQPSTQHRLRLDNLLSDKSYTYTLTIINADSSAETSEFYFLSLENTPVLTPVEETVPDINSPVQY